MTEHDQAAECSCYPGGFTPDSHEGFQRHCAMHGDGSMTEHDDSAEVERLCEVMHDAYEAAAVGAGWETQAASRKPWADVPQANKVTMRAAVRAVLADLRERYVLVPREVAE